MVAQGTVSRDGNLYSFRRGTPTGRRTRSPSPSRNGVHRSSGSSGASNGVVNGVAGASNAYEGQILDLLAQYNGLPLERLNNMLRMAQVGLDRKLIFRYGNLAGFLGDLRTPSRGMMGGA